MSDVKEPEFWLESAKNLIISNNSDSEKYTVTVAMCIHSIIKANDALTMELMDKRAIKHDDATELFRELVQSKRVPSKFADLRQSVLAPAIRLKSAVDYKGSYNSKSDAERWIRNAQKFLNAAKECLNC